VRHFHGCLLSMRNINYGYGNKENQQLFFRAEEKEIWMIPHHDQFSKCHPNEQEAPLTVLSRRLEFR